MLKAQSRVTLGRISAGLLWRLLPRTQALVYDIVVRTRLGLHSCQNDTTPDLTYASCGVVRSWSAYDTTWGSDHFPIQIQLTGNQFRNKRTHKIIDCKCFRQSVQVSNTTTMEEFVSVVQQAALQAMEEVECDSGSPTPDKHSANLWRKVATLTKR